MAYKIIIIGGGAAGVTSAEYARITNPQAEILIFSAEKYLPYFRLRLLSYIGKEFIPEEIAIHKKDWYQEKEINLLDLTVDNINPIEKHINVDGDTYFYDKLILTQGSYAFIPPLEGHSLLGVFAIRTIDDIIGINHQLPNCKSCVIIGGGVLGLETAWVLCNAGIEVTVIDHNPVLLNRQLDAEAGKIVAEKAEELGIRILLEKDTLRLKGENKVNGVELTDGTFIPTEMVIFSTGIRPNNILVEKTGINIGRCAIVNDKMETNIQGIYSAGDSAEYNGFSFGLWNIAQLQGKVAGINAAGGESLYIAPAPSNKLNVFGIKIVSIGNVGQAGESLKTLVSSDGDIFKKLFFKDNILTGAILFNDAKSGPKVKELIEERFAVVITDDVSPETIIKSGR